MTDIPANFASKIIMTYNYTCVKHQIVLSYYMTGQRRHRLSTATASAQVCVEKIVAPLNLTAPHPPHKRFVSAQFVSKIFWAKK
jgi:hypothetical protein